MLGRDVDREILMRMDDKTLLNSCQLNNYYRNEVCDDQFFHRRLQQKYPDTLKDKPIDKKYKTWYLDIVYYVAKLKEDFNYEYTGGNPKIQLQIFKGSKKFTNWFYESVEKGEINLVKYLVSIYNIRPLHINTALVLASSKGELEVVKYLIELGANADDENRTALRAAVYDGHLDVVKFLVEKGANIHFNIEALLKQASYEGYLDIVKYLVEQGADIHSGDDMALKIAKHNGHLEVVEYLKSLN